MKYFSAFCPYTLLQYMLYSMLSWCCNAVFDRLTRKNTMVPLFIQICGNFCLFLLLSSGLELTSRPASTIHTALWLQHQRLIPTTTSMLCVYVHTNSFSLLYFSHALIQTVIAAKFLEFKIVPNELMR